MISGLFRVVELRESKMTDASAGSPGARVRQVRRDAARRGMLVHKAGHDPKLHRYIIIERPDMIKRSHNLEFPYSFSLDEAEAYFAKRV
jgi:hypothetical protein